MMNRVPPEVLCILFSHCIRGERSKVGEAISRVSWNWRELVFQVPWDVRAIEKVGASLLRIAPNVPSFGGTLVVNREEDQEYVVQWLRRNPNSRLRLRILFSDSFPLVFLRDLLIERPLELRVWFFLRELEEPIVTVQYARQWKAKEYEGNGKVLLMWSDKYRKVERDIPFCSITRVVLDATKPQYFITNVYGYPLQCLPLTSPVEGLFVPIIGLSDEVIGVDVETPWYSEIRVLHGLNDRNSLYEFSLDTFELPGIISFESPTDGMFNSPESTVQVRCLLKCGNEEFGRVFTSVPMWDVIHRFCRCYRKDTQLAKKERLWQPTTLGDALYYCEGGEDILWNIASHLTIRELISFIQACRLRSIVYNIRIPFPIPTSLLRIFHCAISSPFPIYVKTPQDIEIVLPFLWRSLLLEIWMTFDEDLIRTFLSRVLGELRERRQRQISMRCPHHLSVKFPDMQGYKIKFREGLFSAALPPSIQDDWISEWSELNSSLGKWRLTSQ